MWTCSSCKHDFVRNNWIHSCRDKVLPDFLANKSEQTLSLFWDFVDSFKEFIDIPSHPTKSMIRFGAKNRIVYVIGLCKDFVLMVRVLVYGIRCKVKMKEKDCLEYKLSAPVKFIFFSALLCSSFVTKAQFNDSINYYVYYGSSGSFNKTNDGNSFILNNIGKFTIDKRKVTLHTINTWIYGEQSGVKINNDFSSVIDLDYLKKQQRFYYWGIATFDKSFSLKINHRFQVGAGLGYNLVKLDNASIVLSDGLIFEQADLTDKELGQLKYDVWRNSFRIKYHWKLHSILFLDGSAFVQPSLASSDDNIIKSSTTLSIKLKKWLSLSSSLVYNKITLTQRENLSLTYGLVVEKFF